MQIKLIAPSHIDTTIQLPSSKSISNRVLIIHALCRHEAVMPQNLSDCDDTRVMIRALQHDSEVIDILAAGTAMRFLTAYLSVTPGTRILTGTQRMRQRPIRALVDALRQLGAAIDYVEQEGYPPLRITGQALHNDRITLPGHISSQYISALLLIAPTLPHGLTVCLEGDIISRPYIDLTLQLMKQFGAEATWTDERHIHVCPQPYRSVPHHVESDWSAASYWYQLAALSPQADILLPGLHQQSCQGDSQGARLFQLLGVETQYTEDGVRLKKTAVKASRIDYDLNETPDLAQTFVVTCALLHIPFRFTGLQTLKIKETDRIAALINEMKKLGYVLHESQGSILWWEGETCPPDQPAVIDTYEDHRMAMAFAPASLVLPDVRINHPEVVSKSYPRYWDDLRKAGFHIEELE